jgi:DNA modification methylase
MGRYVDREFDPCKESEDVLNIHPTAKPIAMIMYVLKDCSKQNHIVLDPFLGSGSALIACEKTKRQCYGIEIEPRYPIFRYAKIP